jgi:hypothetical protein
MVFGIRGRRLLEIPLISNESNCAGVMNKSCKDDCEKNALQQKKNRRTTEQYGGL